MLFAALAAVVLAADQITKAVALAALQPGVPRPFVGSLLQFRLITNPGAAFSLASGFTVVLSVVAICVVLAVLRFSARLASVGWAAALGVLLGGALGNVTDRLFRAPGPLRGHVVDFLQLPNWPIFNVADIGVTFGAIGMGYLALRGVNFDGTRGDPEDEAEPGHDEATTDGTEPATDISAATKAESPAAVEADAEADPAAGGAPTRSRAAGSSSADD